MWIQEQIWFCVDFFIYFDFGREIEIEVEVERKKGERW
jgi:hypothetical protein